MGATNPDPGRSEESGIHRWAETPHFQANSRRENGNRSCWPAIGTSWKKTFFSPQGRIGERSPAQTDLLSRSKGSTWKGSRAVNFVLFVMTLKTRRNRRSPAWVQLSRWRPGCISDRPGTGRKRRNGSSCFGGRYLIHDRDPLFTKPRSQKNARVFRVRSVRLPSRSPKLERLRRGGSFDRSSRSVWRRLIPIGEAHLLRRAVP